MAESSLLDEEDRRMVGGTQNDRSTTEQGRDREDREDFRRLFPENRRLLLERLASRFRPPPRLRVEEEVEEGVEGDEGDEGDGGSELKDSDPHSRMGRFERSGRPCWIRCLGRECPGECGRSHDPDVRTSGEGEDPQDIGTSVGPPMMGARRRARKRRGGEIGTSGEGEGSHRKDRREKRRLIARGWGDLGDLGDLRARECRNWLYEVDCEDLRAREVDCEGLHYVELDRRGFGYAQFVGPMTALIARLRWTGEGHLVWIDGDSPFDEFADLLFDRGLRGKEGVYKEAKDWRLAVRPGVPQ